MRVPLWYPPRSVICTFAILIRINESKPYYRTSYFQSNRIELFSYLTLSVVLLITGTPFSVTHICIHVFGTRRGYRQFFFAFQGFLGATFR